MLVLETSFLSLISLHYSVATQRARHYRRSSHQLYAGIVFQIVTSSKRAKIHFQSSIARCESQEHILGEMRSHSVTEADSMHEHQSAVKQYNYVVSQKFNESENPEFLWRYGRACHCFYAYASASEEEKATAIMDGLKATEKAVLLDPQNAHAFVVSSLDINTVHL